MGGITLLEKIKRRSAVLKAQRELSQSGKTGLALYDYIKAYTGDDNPWIQRPFGVFYNEAHNYIVIANQKTGSVTVLYKWEPVLLYIEVYTVVQQCIAIHK